jgi:prevent-host-death family protein
MANRYSVAEARDHLTKLIYDAERGVAVEITRRGKPVAVLVSLSEYQKLRKGTNGFWHAFERFLNEVDLKGAGIDRNTFKGLRDRTPGREVNL